MPHVNSGDTAWVLASSALVLFMTPGLAFFYGGMVRRKNVLGMLMQNYVVMGIVGVVWAWLTYSLAFGVDWGGHGIIGTFHFAGLLHIDNEAVPGYAGSLVQSIPPIVFVVFQMMFAVITVGLITGSSADRIKFGAFVAFAIAWSVLVYAPVAHWVFSPTGWLAKQGSQDFAGGTVVHINAAMGGAALALVAGRRKGWPRTTMDPHNIPFTVLGAGILWFGWFGFNAGSAFTSGALASSALVNTQLGAAAATLTWLVAERVRNGRVTTVGAATGAVAGLATITPASGYVAPMSALAIGAAAGILCFVAVGVKDRLGYDDSLDVVGVHMVGGILGVILTGAFASLAINPAGAAASLTQVGRQVVLAGVTVGYSFVVTLVILKVVDVVVGLRLSEEHEDVGMDASLHGEVAYRTD